MMHYATYHSSLGRIFFVINASNERLAFLGLLDETDLKTMREQAQQQLKAILICNPNLVTCWQDKLLTQDISQLHLKGSPLQQTVWKEMCHIPKGQTITYSELAKRVNKPKAVRAVASCVAKNPISYVIPCHRVVGKDNTKIGYRWGASLKTRLLNAERN